MSQLGLKQIYFVAYQNFVKPVPGMNFWPDQSMYSTILPPKPRKMPGRPRKKRIRAIGASGSRGREGAGGSRGDTGGSRGDATGSRGGASRSRGGASRSRSGASISIGGVGGSRGDVGGSRGGASGSKRKHVSSAGTQKREVQTQDEDQVKQTQEQAKIDLTRVEQTQEQTQDKVQPQEQPQQVTLRTPSARILQRKYDPHPMDWGLTTRLVRWSDITSNALVRHPGRTDTLSTSYQVSGQRILHSLQHKDRARTLVEPIRLTFGDVEVIKVRTDGKGVKEKEEEDLQKPYKEVLKSLFTRRIIDQPRRMEDAGMVQDVSADLGWPNPTEVSKIIRRANETLPYFKERTEEMSYIQYVPETIRELDEHPYHFPSVPANDASDDPLIIEAEVEGPPNSNPIIVGRFLGRIVNPNRKGKTRGDTGSEGLCRKTMIKYTVWSEKKKIEQEEKKEEAKPKERGESVEEKVLVHSAFSEQKDTIVLVKKVDNTWRMCIDFKNLNSACPKDYYLLPEIDLKIKAVMGFPFKCFLDAYKGYHQIQMLKDDEEKTAFYTDQATYCHSKMPFGLKNVGATYQRSIERAMSFFETLKNIIKENKDDYRWMEDVERAFQEMKKLIIELPTLTTPMPKETLFVYLATSKDATLHTDGAPSLKGVGVGLILIDPTGIEYTYAIRVTFPSTNNEAEYEALLAGLRIVHKIKVKALKVMVDSKLVACQLNNEFMASNEGMEKYLTKAKEHAALFKKISIENIPRNQNQKAYVLRKLDLVVFNHLTKEVLVEVLNAKSIDAQEINAIVEEEEDN
nr:putative reverse transcriptase domain-containing protein [Tanacetum cinerariifolium]